MNTIKEEWREVCDQYLRKFCKRHEFSYEDAYWVGDDPGTLADVDGYFFGMDEIRYDVDNEIPDDTILDWYDYALEVHSIEADYREMHHVKEFIHINYASWCKGGPRPYSTDDLSTMREYIALWEKAKKDLADYKPRYDGLNMKHSQAFPSLRKMEIGDEGLFPKGKWNAVRSAASVLKRNFGSVFKVHKDGDVIHVKRIS